MSNERDVPVICVTTHGTDHDDAVSDNEDPQLLSLVQNNRDLASMISELSDSSVPEHGESNHNSVDYVCDASPDDTSSSEKQNYVDDIKAFCREILDALNETSTEKTNNSIMKSKPNAYTLRKDIKRCISECKPYVDAAHGIHELLIWQRPLVTLGVFAAYMYAIWCGWILAFPLFLIILQLTVNLIDKHTNRNLGLFLLSQKEKNADQNESKRAPLVFDAARKAQILVQFVANVLEKIRELFTWKNPDVTLKFLTIVTAAFAWTLIVPPETCLITVGLAAGVYAFVIVYLFHRFPKLRITSDIFAYFYKEDLPPPSQKATRIEKSNSENFSQKSIDTTETQENAEVISSKNNSVFDSESHSYSIESISSKSTTPTEEMLVKASELQSTESIPNTDNSQDDNSTTNSSIADDNVITYCLCVMLHKSYSRSVIPGTLYLNEASLKFRIHKAKDGTLDQFYVPFEDIKAVAKIKVTKTFGSSKSIELHLFSSETPVQFIGIHKRDEFYESLIAAARIESI